MNYPQKLKDRLNTLPRDTGVYLMKNSSGKVIYVGKAKNLRNRVRSYFQSSRFLDPKTEKMVSKISTFEVLVTDSEMEALILEANLIKEHRPRYNVDLKDDKRFPYIKITMQDRFPRVEITRVLEKDGSKYFGPCTDARRMRSTVDFLHDLFPLRTCAQFPSKESNNKPCLNYQIGRCLGTCIGKAARDDYMKMIDYVIKFLSGKKREMLSELKEQMNKYSAELNFEAAARCRDQIQSMERVIQKQKVVSIDGVDRDYIGSAEVGDDGCFSVMQVRDGVLMGRQHFYYSTGSDNKGGFLKNFIINYYRNTAVFPREILISADVADRELLEEKLSRDAKHKVEIIKPQRGKKAGLLNLAESNATLLLDQLLTQKAKAKSKLPHYLYDLQSILNLENIPRKISAFDISNLGESEAVGSMVFFNDGKPRKSNYRHFKIKTVKGQDDFAMMGEVVSRYCKRIKEDTEEIPDMILIDGGKGQLNAAAYVLKEFNISIPVISLAKRIDEVFAPGKKDSIIIPHGSSSLKLLQRIRDEAHRFAIEYHRKLRGKKVISSELDKISGVGEMRKLNLLAKFGSVSGVKNASFAEILTCPGIPKNIAATVFKFFHPQEEITEKG